MAVMGPYSKSLISSFHILWFFSMIKNILKITGFPSGKSYLWGRGIYETI